MKKIIAIIMTFIMVVSLSSLSVFAQTEYVDYFDSDAINNYWDDLWIDGEHVANSLPISPDQYINNVGGWIDNSDGSISEISVRGWVGFPQEITAMGYCIDDGDMIVDEKAFDEDPDAGIIAAAGEYGKRFNIVIPVDEIRGECDIYIVAKLADGTFVLLNNDTSPSLNMVIPFEGPKADETTAEPTSEATAEPTDSATEAPATTPAQASPTAKPAATQNTTNSSPASSSNSGENDGGNTWLIIGIVAAVVVVVAVVIVIIVVKKKKK